MAAAVVYIDGASYTQRKQMASERQRKETWEAHDYAILSFYPVSEADDLNHFLFSNSATRI
jgi:hypothetical protein